MDDFDKKVLLSLEKNRMMISNCFVIGTLSPIAWIS